jgi:hypothetical protein
VVADRRRQERALQLHLSGRTYQEIADSPDPDRAPGTSMYSDRAAAYNAVQAAMDRHVGTSTTTELRHREHARYEAVVRVLWDRVQAGDPLAIQQWLQVSREMRRMLGLDAPARRRVDVIPEDVVDAEIQRLEAEIEHRRPR